MNPKSASSAAGSMNVKSTSGSTGSSFAMASDMGEAEAEMSGSGYVKGPTQKLIIDTFDIPTHLTRREKVSDLRVTYAKYLAIQDVARRLTQMEVARTWTYKKPTLEDIVEVFMFRSGYFNHPHKLFPKLHVIPDMKKWLENGDDAPADAEVWGERRPSFKSLKEILAAYETSGRKKKEKMTNREKKKQKADSASESSEEIVKGKGKAKAKAKKGASKKASSSKSHQDNN